MDEPDLSLVEGFEWDDGNARKSVDKHDVSRQEAEQVFMNQPLVVVGDAAHSVLEQRYQALGQTGMGRLLHITFTMRDERRKIRVISARAMSRKERSIYEKA